MNPLPCWIDVYEDTPAHIKQADASELKCIYELFFIFQELTLMGQQINFTEDGEWHDIVETVTAALAI